MTTLQLWNVIRWIWNKKYIKLPYSGHFYSGHLSTTDVFFSNWWNDSQTLIIKCLFTGCFTADTSLQRTFFLGPYLHYRLELKPLWWTRPVTGHIRYLFYIRYFVHIRYLFIYISIYSLYIVNKLQIQFCIWSNT